MRLTLKMPKLGDAADKVVIVEICVAPGETVPEGKSLFVVETDKANLEVPSPYAGVVSEIAVAVGDEVAVGAPILVLQA